MKYFATLKIKDIISLVLFLAAGFGWILIDQVFMPETWQRIIALILVLTILFLLQFLINKPEKVLFYANTLAGISVLFVLLTSIVTHVIIHHDFSAKGIILLLTTATAPYCSAGIYSLTRKRKE